MHRFRIPAKAFALVFGCLFCAQPFPLRGQEGQLGAAQQNTGLPSVAIMEPSATSAGASTKTAVSAMDKLAVRGTLSEYLTRSRRYRVLDRARIDQIAKEQDFQRKGLVNQTTIKKMGEMMGADFICTLELMRDDSVFGVNVALIDVVTGEQPFSSFEMTPNYSAMTVKSLAEAIGRKILAIDQTEREMREEEERAERERNAAERARQAAAEKARQEAADRERRAATDRERQTAAAREQRAAEERARQTPETFGTPSSGRSQKVNELLSFFNTSGGAFTHKALAQYLQARQQTVMNKREEYWHSVIVEIRNGALTAYSKYVCPNAKNQISHSKISAEMAGRILSLPLAAKITKSSILGTITEEAPITNTEWLRAIAANPGTVTIRLTGPTGAFKEYAMSDVVHAAIVQTLELYDAQQQK
jgi:regulator of protease activity HflC (stomatin/prohibitin superfamily)